MTRQQGSLTRHEPSSRVTRICKTLMWKDGSVHANTFVRNSFGHAIRARSQSMLFDVEVDRMLTVMRE